MSIHRVGDAIAATSHSVGLAAQGGNCSDTVTGSIDVLTTNRRDDDRTLLTLGEAAQLLRVSKAHLSNIVNRKVPSLPPPPVMRIGRRLLLRRDALMQWLKTVER